VEEGDCLHGLGRGIRKKETT